MNILVDPDFSMSLDIIRLEQKSSDDTQQLIEALFEGAKDEKHADT